MNKLGDDSIGENDYVSLMEPITRKPDAVLVISEDNDNMTGDSAAAQIAEATEIMESEERPEIIDAAKTAENTHIEAAKTETATTWETRHAMDVIETMHTKEATETTLSSKTVETLQTEVIMDTTHNAHSAETAHTDETENTGEIAGASDDITGKPVDVSVEHMREKIDEMDGGDEDGGEFEGERDITMCETLANASATSGKITMKKTQKGNKIWMILRDFSAVALATVDLSCCTAIHIPHCLPITQMFHQTHHLTNSTYSSSSNF